jgi:DNA polymerase-4/DNA polymerase V
MPEDRPLMLSSWPRAIVHIDGDAFFASCEQAVHPEYRGRAVITGKERGIVAAASYEAKARGVSRGTPLWEVKKLIPDAIIVPSDYETYSLFSKRMFAIMRRTTSLVEEYSIDEAFAEITGLRRPNRCSYETIAMRMKTAIESELGLTVSVGLSLSKTLAKVGSKWKKPAGFTAIPGRKIHQFLDKLPLEKIWGIGPSNAAYGLNLGMRTALDFARKSEDYVNRHFIKPQFETWQELNGEAVYPIVTEEKDEYATISKTKTFTPASESRDFVFAQLVKNLENACIKARRHHLVARGLILYLRKQDYRSAGIEARLSRPTAFVIEMMRGVETAFAEIYRARTPYRATGVILTDLTPDDALQMSLFESPVRLEKLGKLYEAMDELAKTYGKHCVVSGGAVAAHRAQQHVLERGDIPRRKLERLEGETKRKHLGIPLLMNPRGLDGGPRT